MATSDLFSKAKKSATKSTTTKKDDKTIIIIDQEDFFDKVKKLSELQTTMDSAKASADMITDELKDLSKEKWLEKYSDTGKNPGSVILQQEKDNDTAQFMFVPSDRYITIDEDRADELTEIYGEDIVEENTEFGFDSKMIEKYGEILSKLILESDEIDDKDKEKIIVAKTKYSVKKGTIDNFADYGDIYEIMEAVRPVVAVKNVQVING
jgi:hypothetical protein